MGFEVNPYDPCVANKDINGSQMTVTWHVDDLKVSHKDPGEVTQFLRDMVKYTAMLLQLREEKYIRTSEWILTTLPPKQ